MSEAQVDINSGKMIAGSAINSSQIKAQLFADPDQFVYAVLDGAAMPDLPLYLSHSDAYDFETTLRGWLNPELAKAAPYLVALKQDSKLVDWLLGDACTEYPNLGTLIRSGAGMRAMRQHCREISEVSGPNQQFLFFRWYDPRVFTAFMFSSKPEQLNDFFGPITLAVLPTAGAFSVYQHLEGRCTQIHHPRV